MMSLETLLRAARAGDRRVWPQLAKTASQRLRAYFRQQSLQADASDLAQRTLLLVHERLPRLEHQKSLEGWLFAIGRNLAREQRRARARHEALCEKMANVPNPAPPGPSTVVRQEEVYRVVEEEFDKLPEPLREVLEHDLDGQPSRELAAKRSINPDTVRTRRNRARGVLRTRVLMRLR
jgi:RNA polymerase sigma-70 factor (ECF subfamily)